MRDMANSTPASPRASRWRWLTLPRLRPWVQALFLPVWLSPLGWRALWLPTCVFHCHGCALAGFACPLGVMGQFAALHVVPILAIGVLALIGGLAGSLVCGWACPIGFLQDLAGRVPLPKFELPNWTGYGRYLVLAGFVLMVPYLWGIQSDWFFCRWCPVGTLESAVPDRVRQAWAGQWVGLPWARGGVLAAFVVAIFFVHRPWCRVLCPLGGILALFNRFSLFFLRFEASTCTECNLCRSRCKYGVKVDERVNNASCVRCLECTACKSIKPALAGVRVKPVAPDRVEAGA